MPVTTRAGKQKFPPTVPKRETWLTPFEAVWKAKWPDAVVPYQQLARYLKPLVEAHPVERVCAELAGFLAQTEARYLSLAKFAATFGSWSKPNVFINCSHAAPLRPMCALHPERPSVGEVSRVKCCRECFDDR